MARLDAERLAELESVAAEIPSMGGLQIGAHLRKAAREDALPGTAIVELGSWLGAGTAQLALGLRERPDSDGIEIHCFDRYQATSAEEPKAAKAGLTLVKDQDTLPIVKRLLEPFDAPIKFHKGTIEKKSWAGAPISVFVQDAGKSSASFFPMIKAFGPSWMPEKTVIFFMDYYNWRKSGVDDHKCQTRFVEAHPESFSIPVPLFGSVVTVRYLKPLDFSALA